MREYKKKDGSVSRILFPDSKAGVAVIPLPLILFPSGVKRPTRSSPIPIGNRSGRDHPLLFGLAPDGVCPHHTLTGGWSGLLPHLFTLTPTGCRGGIVSVALSLLPTSQPGRLRFPERPALWSPDFPPPRIIRRSDRPTHPSLPLYHFPSTHTQKPCVVQQKGRNVSPMLNTSRAFPECTLIFCFLPSIFARRDRSA